jgi:sec-independent protein translocase protein TatA
MERKRMPFGAHWWDLLPLVILALLFFGPKRLPEMGSSIGRTIKEFQKSMREVREPESTNTNVVPPATTQAAPELPAAPTATATVTPVETPKE